MKIISFIIGLTVCSVNQAEESVKSNLEPVTIKEVHKGSLSGLNLTKEQKKKLATIMKAERTEMKKFLKDSSGKKKKDKESINKFRERIKSRKKAVDEKIKSILTAEQLALYKKNKKAREDALPKMPDNK